MTNLAEYTAWMAEAFTRTDDNPKTIIVGPRAAAAIVRSVENMPGATNARQAPGSAHQRRVARRAARRMWDRIKYFAAYGKETDRIAIRA